MPSFLVLPLMNFRSNFTNVNWVSVALALSVAVDVIWVFPGLRNGSIVPDVALVGKAVGDESELALLNVLEFC